MNYVNISQDEYLDLLSIKRKASRAGLLSDFSYTLATAIEDELQYMNEPVFTNPRSGRLASSLYGIVKAMGGALGVHPLRRAIAPLGGASLTYAFCTPRGLGPSCPG
jgi:hypothetical protein